VASLARKIAYVSRLQLVFLSLTWLAGIYVNGFVAIIPGTGAGAILLDPAVASHVVLATLSAATSVFILALAWASGSRRLTGLTILASISIVLAGDSGLAFVLGGGSDAAQSMIMATSFVTAIFLTFLSMASLKADDGRSGDGGRGTRRTALYSCYLALLLFYAVFVSGIYVNLFVAGPVFSLPLGRELAAFTEAESSASFLIHEALGGALLATLVALVVSLWSGGEKRVSFASGVAALLVAYSAYVGSLNISSPPVPAVSSSGGATSALVPMLSSAGLAAAIVITMLIALRITASRAAA
jgi:Ca2+/H+ antiporter